MNRTELHAISRQRRREAAALLHASMFTGSYYLAGYSVECALKACIAKRTRKHDFPDKRLASDCWTHDLEKLVQVAGLAPQLAKDTVSSPALQINWAIVKDWSEAARYDLTITAAQAKDLYSACTRRHAGLLSWIRLRW
jgi:hypothetical protein